jgi:polysaccharide biosynthesis/export protein
MELKCVRSVAAIVLSLMVSIGVVGQASPQHPDASTQGTGQSATEQSPAGSNAHDATFIIGVDDVLAINVWKETDLSRTIPVRTDGKISLPLVGELQAAGRTPLQLEQQISERLKSYMTEPEVSVMVQQINSEKVDVLGQVAKPGSYSLSSASTVVDAISAAGGLKDFAKKKSIYVLRKNASGQEQRIAFNYSDFLKGKSAVQNVKLEPHDMVVVP